MKEERNLRKEKKMLLIRLIGGFGIMVLSLMGIIFNINLNPNIIYFGLFLTSIRIIYVNLRNAGVL